MIKVRQLLLLSLLGVCLTLTGCSTPLSTNGMDPADRVDLDDYDKAVIAFEAFLDEAQRIQEVISNEPWRGMTYGNRPTTCERGPGGDFGFVRASVHQDKAVEHLETNLNSIAAQLENLGFQIDGPFADQSGNHPDTPKSFGVTGETGSWLITSEEDGQAIGISGSSGCVDIDPRPVWDEMTKLGFSYVDSNMLYLRPHERLPIRRGETPYVYPASTETPTPTASATTTPHPSRTARPTRTPRPTDTRQPWSPTSTP